MSLTTNVTFLEKIIDGDEISWDHFSRIYSPLIRECGKHWALSADECDELEQEVLITFFRNSQMFKYDRNKGTFRSYLRITARMHTFAILKRRNDDNLPDNGALLDYAFDEKWDAEWHNFLCAEALKILAAEMEELSYRSFYMYVMEEIPPAEVASELGISINAVYVNKSRALEHLRRTIRTLESL